MSGSSRQPAQTSSPQDTLYAARKKLYVRAVSGVFANWRWAMVWITQLVFYGLPWLSWNDRQAVLFHLAERKFYLFGWVFWPQDVFFLAVLLIISAYALFFFTAIAAACGAAMPVRRRCTPKYSCGSSRRSRVTISAVKSSTGPR